MTRIEDKFTDVLLQSTLEENGKFYVIGEILTEDFECENGMNALAKDSVRQAITWRHRHPLDKDHKQNHVYGRVENAWINEINQRLTMKAEVFSHTEDHRNLIEDIKKRDFVKDPLGWSMHYRTYFNEEGKKYHWDVFEIAGTPDPACKKCKTLSFGVEKMEDKNKDKDKEKTKEDEKELEEKTKVEDALKTIKDLETKLNSKTESFEDLRSKVEKLEANTKSKDKELETKAKEEKSLKDRVLEMENTIKYLESKKPILDQILEANPEIDDNQYKWLKTMDIKYLAKRLEYEKGRAITQIQVQELEDSAKKSKADKEKEDKKLEEVSLEHFTSELDDDFKKKE